MAQTALDELGDIASVNCWRAHDPNTGYQRFFSNTPKWVLEIAKKRRWIA
jgi:hypothetical protein